MGAIDRPGAVSELVQQVFAAYRTRDRAALEALLSEDFTFSSPYDDRIGRQEYFARCWPNSEHIRAHHIRFIAENGDDAFVLYDCELNAGPVFRNTEFFRFDGGRLRAIEVYFGDPPIGIAKQAYPDFVTMALKAWNAERATVAAEAGIHDLIEARAAALRAKDAAGVIACYAAEAVRFELAPPLRYRGEAAGDGGLETWFASFTGAVGYELADLTVEAGDTLGFSYALVHLTGSRTDGAETDMWFRNTLCFRRAGAAWTIVHDHSSVPFHMDGSLRAAVDLTP